MRRSLADTDSIEASIRHVESRVAALNKCRDRADREYRKGLALARQIDECIERLRQARYLIVSLPEYRRLLKTSSNSRDVLTQNREMLDKIDAEVRVYDASLQTMRTSLRMITHSNVVRLVREEK